MPFLMSPTIIAVIAACLLQGLTLGWGLYQSNRADNFEAKAMTCAAQHQAFVEQVRAEGERMMRRAAEITAKNEVVTQEIKRDYQTALDRMRADYKRLRQQYSTGSGSGQVSAVPEAASRVDAIPADCLPLAEQSAETTLMLTSLQDWIQQQTEAGNGQ